LNAYAPDAVLVISRGGGLGTTTSQQTKVKRTRVKNVRLVRQKLGGLIRSVRRAAPRRASNISQQKKRVGGVAEFYYSRPCNTCRRSIFRPPASPCLPLQYILFRSKLANVSCWPAVKRLSIYLVILTMLAVCPRNGG